MASPRRITRPSKDEVFMVMTRELARLSTCRRRAAACILIDKDYEVLGQGYNGNPRGQSHCLDYPCPGAEAASGRDLDACEALHAEWNALQRCRDHKAIWTAFLTCEPCTVCFKMLLNTPCRRIIFNEPYSGEVGYGTLAARWKRAGRVWLQAPAAWTATKPSLSPTEPPKPTPECNMRLLWWEGLSK